MKQLSKQEMEGGCGVIGFASAVPLAGRHLFYPLVQMHNRGNGKGGGLAAAGCFPEYRDFYALQVGYLDQSVRKVVEETRITPFFDVEKTQMQESLRDFREVPGLEIRPPDVVRYFCRVKRDVLEEFALKRGFKSLSKAEDQFVYENTYSLNREYYADIEDKKAFVLSHGKDLMVLKGVGYAEHFITYYRLEDFKARIWIGHQRYPTRGRVWHPGGAHPFIGLNDALVHNGDFANYYSVCEYLKQRDIEPLFLTDTEVAALVFDYYTRNLGYDLETTIEALAPTTERDFDLLPKARQRLYRAIRMAHIHASPDGPWFFIIVRSLPEEGALQLLGITDTGMLRPHVFALDDGPSRIGLIASEKQAIDAVLASIAAENEEVCPVADRYWISRGGSHTDGGSFVFTVKDGTLTCHDKFGKAVEAPRGEEYGRRIVFGKSAGETATLPDEIKPGSIPPAELFNLLRSLIASQSYEDFLKTLSYLINYAEAGDEERFYAIETLSLLRDREYNPGSKRRKWLAAMGEAALNEVLSSIPETSGKFILADFHNKKPALEGDLSEKILVIDATGFPQEGVESVSRLIVGAYGKGCRRFIAFRLKGDRFIGCGLGANSAGVRIDTYGSCGDYAGSGLDGAELYIHGSGQDQLGQILNSGKIVIYGDVGQTFLYGAKGGEVYVMGNTAGRPLINAVGSIRAVINGTCLEYAAESFMAGAELGGGFLILNGLKPNVYGEFMGLQEKFSGSNFFSLASGGAGYLNDPYHTVTEDQLNGGEFTEFTQDDWNVIHSCLRENERLFGIQVERDLLTVDRIRKWPSQVFRKVIACRKPALAVVE
ncbi:MAG: glutamate synthase [bacterium]